jgi:signal peptidase I
MRFFSRSSYSLKKSKTILRQAYHIYLRKKQKLPDELSAEILKTLSALQQEILSKNTVTAANLAKQLETLCEFHLKKSTFDQLKDLVFALIFALGVAILIRQMWFEFYEIPSGSMRPTLKEQDRLVVSKTDFGINMPLHPKHLYFDPKLVQRSGIAIFTGENMDIRDVDTMYFYIFPGKKQYVKRIIGKPGDILYFYGGEIYAIDQMGNNVSHELQLPQLNLIEHIPFIDFDRKITMPETPVNGIYSPIYIYQMNEAIAKLYTTAQNQVRGEMLNPSQIHYADAPKIEEYSDLWGFKNYGMSRLLTKEQVKFLTDQDPSTMEEGILYLEIKHHPSILSAKLIRDEYGRLRPSMGLSTSIIPLQEHHLRTILANMYTARFEVTNGFAYRWGLNPQLATKNMFLPHLPNIPNGCYEFYYGKASKVKWQGITEQLPPTHPLYTYDPQRVQLLYNIGIEFDTRFAPQTKNQRLNPARYTYFRNGELYLLGAPILTQEDPTLLEFLKREEARKLASNPQNPYLPFADAGSPLKEDGVIDIDFIRQYGILVPPKMYLVLGDNHAMSADSREFGFVPESNLRGGPDFIFWPPGPRWGYPNQPEYPWVNFPRAIIWLAAFACIGTGTLYWRSRNHLPLKGLK